MPWENQLLLFVAAMLGGAVNAVAGGGTLLTFPALLWSGQLAIVANATSTVALWPGALGSFWGYRGELGSSRGEIFLLSIPSFLGGVVGAVLLLRTDNATFDALVPYLILLATLLFVAQEPLARRLRRREEAEGDSPVFAARELDVREGESGEGDSPIFAAGKSGQSPAGKSGQSPAGQSPPRIPSRKAVRWAGVLGFQLLVGVYGGYFGAGIGILMLAAFGFLGFTNIHHMNALKNLNNMCINGIAAAIFIAKGLVDWRLVLWMAAGAILGGYAGAGTARRIGQKNVRRLVIFIGSALTITLLLR